ncbi:MAG: hypothetical protein ACK53I_11610 [Phenylobacterium sp.]|jgi:hypothetical protein
MNDLARDLHADTERAKKRRKFEAAGIFNHVCVTCPEDDPLCLTFEHVAGQKHDDAVALVCMNCKAKRDCSQRAEPSPSDNPRNVFEVIGRWLLGMAGYFEILMTNLHRFGDFLITLAKAGYGDDLSFA